MELTICQLLLEFIAEQEKELTNLTLIELILTCKEYVRQRTEYGSSIDQNKYVDEELIRTIANKDPPINMEKKTDLVKGGTTTRTFATEEETSLVAENLKNCMECVDPDEIFDVMRNSGGKKRMAVEILYKRHKLPAEKEPKYLILANSLIMIIVPVKDRAHEKKVYELLLKL